jgi:hypothetical protein
MVHVQGAAAGVVAGGDSGFVAILVLIGISL